MMAAPIPLHALRAVDDERDPDRAEVLLALVDRALGEHAGAACMTVDEYARDVARCSRSAAYEAVKAGQLPSFKVAGAIRIPVAAVAAQLLGLDVSTSNAPKARTDEWRALDSDDHRGRHRDVLRRP